MAEVRPRQWRVTIRRPEYTGENRCLPCTAVNLALTGVFAGVIALVSRGAAVVFVVFALSSIAFRGYLVPGTPTLTKRYFPKRLLSWFGKGDEVPVEQDVFDVAGFLEASGIVEVDGDDVTIAPEFEIALGDAVYELTDEPAIRRATAQFLAVDSDRISLDRGDPWTVRVGDSIVGSWESRAAFVTDLGADRLLAERDPDWGTRSVATRGRTLSAIRACLDICPVCAGEVRLGTTTVETCCREEVHVRATCAECDAPLFESRASALGIAG